MTRKNRRPRRVASQRLDSDSRLKPLVSRLRRNRKKICPSGKTIGDTNRSPVLRTWLRAHDSLRSSLAFRFSSSPDRHSHCPVQQSILLTAPGGGGVRRTPRGEIFVPSHVGDVLRAHVSLRLPLAPRWFIPNLREARGESL